MKRIRTASDLAIHGAPPAFAEPRYVGRPNVGDRSKLLGYLGDILDRNWLTNNGPLVQELERKIAAYLGVKHCVAMCNGTVALEVATRALGLQGEVIVPAYTFIATAHALTWQGISPVFADIDPATHQLDPASVRSRITSRTTGIIGVHLWGRPAPARELEAVAAAHGLKLLFDAAHAFGATHRGLSIGSFGACEVLSFHATKFFNTFEGGAIVTNDDALAERAALMRNFGFAGFDNVVSEGTNGKMTEISAAMGLVNLERVDEFIATNRRNHQAYEAALGGLPGLRLLPYAEGEKNNYQYVVVEVGDAFGAGRDEIVAALAAENVIARKYFWPGAHNMQPYKQLNPGAGGALRNTEDVARKVIVLPTGSAVDEQAVEVIAGVFKVLAQKVAR